MNGTEGKSEETITAVPLGAGIESREQTPAWSTACCTRFHNGTPLAMTSMRRLSGRCSGTLRFRRSTLQATAAPAPLHTRAVARSRGSPRVRSKPRDCHQAHPGDNGNGTWQHLAGVGAAGAAAEGRKAGGPLFLPWNVSVWLVDCHTNRFPERF